MPSQIPCALVAIPVGLLFGTVLAGLPVAHAGDFWADLANPGHRIFAAELARAKKAMAHAQRLERKIFAIRAPSLRKRARREQQHLIDQLRRDALAASRRAIVADPKRGLGHLYAGKALYGLGRCEEAVKAFERARALDAALGADLHAAFELGICHSKAGRFASAVAAYDRVERIYLQSKAGRGSLRGVAHGNAAESLMALGRLDEAIVRYRTALRFDRDPLLLWGLAVALDRDEQLSKSSEALKRAMGVKGDGMAHLTRGGVFFIPAGDVHYYLGLGHAFRGETAQARAAFSKFLSMRGTSQWAFRARAHLASLGQPQLPSKRRRPLAPQPTLGRTSYAEAMDRRTVLRAVRSEYYAFRFCYRRALRKKPSLAGQMTLEVVVGANGRARSVRVQRNTVRSPALSQCVLKRLRKRYFGRPRSKKAVKVMVPVEFKP